ncbi:dTDP-3-amino-2,3, 6-trideoxy-4-keto-D-glucose/dTDP-3-amino-3,4, 6-trideoxy-alpha-D-glucose/dTDP-2,6-dideoxy-D-kanosamine transaminase [Anaerolineales bacterium]|nr:dTDP-3-amino-2,3, 6-trideoxy-4-keto-D-glucose/dTDP-3-amino-3,4, 6-trideoxy-alpha-D-glucose/dTDP-2,6-dideoxy-D-kanosamine transaminase [Anaerolineales bacterium]
MSDEIFSIDLKAQYLSIQPEVDAAIARVFASGQFILGAEVEAFEREFAEACGVSHAVGVDSGTSAIQLSLLACSVGAGDEVITVSNTAVATVTAIELTGAKPVLVDVHPQTLTLDPSKLEGSLTSRTRAVVPVHLFGCPADLNPILDFARTHGLFVVEDCAQAHGATYHGKPVGGWGHLSAFSFYPTKNLGAYGDGGAVLTNDSALAERVRLLRQYGWDGNRISQQKGMNTRLDEMQAAILRVKLRHLDQWNDRRRELAALYKSLLMPLVFSEANPPKKRERLTLPVEPPETHHVYHQFVVRHPQRDALRNYLLEHGIHTQIHYPVPIHLQPAYRDLAVPLPVTESAADQILSLPLYPELRNEDVEKVCQTIHNFDS